MPKLSIVVPTRNRADTLIHTIRTLVDQDFEDREIIVSDNASQDDTKTVVESFSGAGIRYVNTGQPLSMSDNWEFALGHVRGEFVTYIGDDDGFIPGAIGKAMRLLDRERADALVWTKVEYCWPDHVDEGLRNLIILHAHGNSIQLVRSRNKLKKVMSFREGYNRLPCLYNAIVRRTAVDRVRSLSTNGVFFNSIAPDVYSGIALSGVVGTYLATDYPLSVNGASRHSNGTASSRSSARDPNSPFGKFMAENSRRYDPRILVGPSWVIPVMGEYLLVRQFLPGLGLPEPGWRNYVRSLVRASRSTYLPEELLLSAAHTVRALGIRTAIPGVAPPAVRLVQSMGLQQDSISFKAPVDMVRNVHDACRLVAGMLPESMGAETATPLGRFVRELRKFLISEAKTFYRAL